MKKVITYGTYDMLHEGHIRLLKRAKDLGDYLIVGVTADDFDKNRGKINVKQTLMERIEAVKATGIADEIIVEEYEGQKIDDIQRYDIDIFTVGSDWYGQFDYLKEYCEVIYLERTQGISSSQIRTKERFIKVGLVGDVSLVKKYYDESKYVNGLEIISVYSLSQEIVNEFKNTNVKIYSSYEELVKSVDAVFLISHPTLHYSQIRYALEKGKHVLCESPIALHHHESIELIEYAKAHNLILMDAIKTAYSTAYNRLMLLMKSGKIGDILSIDATCTSLINDNPIDETVRWNSICGWGPTAMLPIFQILGTNYKDINIHSLLAENTEYFDLFTKIDFVYEDAVASVKLGKGVKSEGNLVISGTKGYIYVPSPWWKTDYFEIRYENQNENKRYFYQLEGEGIRYEFVIFLKLILGDVKNSYIHSEITSSISKVIEDYYLKNNWNCIHKKSS